LATGVAFPDILAGFSWKVKEKRGDKIAKERERRKEEKGDEKLEEIAMVSHIFFPKSD